MVLRLVLKLVLGVLGTLTAGRFGLGIYAWQAAEKLARPSYHVVQRLSGGIELRRYDGYVVAEATINTPSMREASSAGFRKVAGFIFGKNRPRRFSGRSGATKMAMTAPVRMEVEAEQTRVSFVMSANETLQSLPVPMDSSITLRKEKPCFAAFAKFSGAPPTESLIAKKRQAVISALEASGLQPTKDGETLVYGYHDPFITPNFLRKNEVGVRIAL